MVMSTKLKIGLLPFILARNWNVDSQNLYLFYFSSHIVLKVLDTFFKAINFP